MMLSHEQEQRDELLWYVVEAGMLVPLLQLQVVSSYTSKVVPVNPLVSISTAAFEVQWSFTVDDAKSDREFLLTGDLDGLD
jgi:hypothetical protein